jgi:fatty-acyl-CoA synthase
MTHVPTKPCTIDDALEIAAGREGRGFTFVDEQGRELTRTWAELRQRALGVAHALQERGVAKGDRVAMIVPDIEEFVTTFLAAIVAGGVPVPMFPPMGLGQLTGYVEHTSHIVAAAKPAMLVTSAEIRGYIEAAGDALPKVPLATFDDLQGDASAHRKPALRLEDTGFIQFTSGSTARPKGVVLSHGNLFANAWCIMHDGLKTSPERDRGVSWLPLYHDMGLIGFVLAPIFHHVPVTFMQPLSFLKRPATWLKLLAKHKGTISYAPNFAYALATKRVKDAELEGVDLSSWRIAGCGAEPIQAATLRGFARRFEAFGFRESSFVPSYGMAESSLAISFANGLPVDVVDGEKLRTESRAVPVVAGAPGSVEIVACGPQFPAHDIRILATGPDGDPTMHDLPERHVGEIALQGPSVTKGYFEDHDRTAQTIRDGWLLTGDLGYKADGQVHICGRKKDVIIVHGRNYYPQDLEWEASRVDGVRVGNVVAFGTGRTGIDREAVVLVAEVKDGVDAKLVGHEVCSVVQTATGLHLDEVVLVPAGTIPKTSSGKVQRAKTKALFEAGELPRI